MRLLLDTHALLWWLDDPGRLSPAALAAIRPAKNEVSLSLASVWEMAIKISLGKLILSRELAQVVAELGPRGVSLLPIQVGHCLTVGQLPFHHRDPFDRMLVSQALHEGLEVVSRDPAFDAYPVRRIW